jgi:hypothetical protein
VVVVAVVVAVAALVQTRCAVAVQVTPRLGLKMHVPAPCPIRRPRHVVVVVAVVVLVQTRCAVAVQVTPRLGLKMHVPAPCPIRHAYCDCDLHPAFRMMRAGHVLREMRLHPQIKKSRTEEELIPLSSALSVRGRRAVESGAYRSAGINWRR